MTHVLVTAPFTEPQMDKIRAVSHDLEVEQIRLERGEWPEKLRSAAEIIYATAELPRLDQAPNLRWVQTHYAGVDKFVNTPLWESDILITSASGIHATNIAQYVMAQILAWANRVPRWITTKKAGEWPNDRWKKFLPDELRGRTLGIVGYGSIGREVARLGKAFGMVILASKRNARRLEDDGFRIHGTGDPNGELPDRIYPTEAIRSMVGECDYVIITAPLTEQTYHLFSEDVLRSMKPTSYLINIGRGAIINETDLVRALDKGWIAGAGLDVFEEEPLPSSSPLWKVEDIILSPHVSGFTPHYDDRATDLFTENLRRYLAGEPLLNVVNRQLGY